MKRKRFVLAISAVIGFAIGFPGGFAYARRTVGLGIGMMSQWAAVGTYAQLADFQYQYADEPHARAALFDFLSFTERLRAGGIITDPKALEISIARAYVRLAVLDRQAGNTDDYQSDLSHAQAALTAAGSPHNSVEDVERSVNQLESQR